jgi:very-short-patch-repair endonuclease/predicted transcriptional regulator of viral defense system
VADEARRKTTEWLAFRVEPPRDQAIADLAAAQHGVFALAHLVALGLSPSAVRERATAGRLHRIHHGVYSLVPAKLLSRNGRFMAAVLACGEGAALSCRSAGALGELTRLGRAMIEVTVPVAGGRARKGIRVHRSTTLRPTDVTTVDGIPCTTVARTLLDLAETLDDRGIERALDHAASAETLDLAALHEQIEHNHARPAAAKLRAAIERHLPGTTPTASELEERMLTLIRDANLPEPEVNVWVDLGDGEPPIKADFLWPGAKLIVETDGFATHGTRTAFESDRRRDQRAAAAGFRSLRFTWNQLCYEPERAVSTLAAAA